jgi:hypothetical protein
MIGARFPAREGIYLFNAAPRQSAVDSASYPPGTRDILRESSDRVCRNHSPPTRCRRLKKLSYRSPRRLTLTVGCRASRIRMTPQWNWPFGNTEACFRIWTSSSVRKAFSHIWLWWECWFWSVSSCWTLQIYVLHGPREDGEALQACNLRASTRIG